jgi:hypothetical protein
MVETKGYTLEEVALAFDGSGYKLPAEPADGGQRQQGQARCQVVGHGPAYLCSNESGHDFNVIASVYTIIFS